MCQCYAAFLLINLLIGKKIRIKYCVHFKILTDENYVILFKNLILHYT